MYSPSRVATWAIVASCLIATPVSAQTGQPATGAAETSHQQVVSANPFGLLLGLFNAEYERTLNDSVTLGGGGSFLESDDDDYVNADVFVRFYPSGDALDGWTFGVKAGLTSVDSSTYFGVGFDANWSWLRGPRDNFYVGAGFGLKRLFGTGETGYLKFVPTVRVINIGVAF